MILKSNCIAFLFLLLLQHGNAQIIYDLFNYNSEDQYIQLVSLKNSPLFNKDDIRKQKVTSCIVLQIEKNLDNVILRNDSLAIFRFDEWGNVSEHYSKVNPWHKAHHSWDTIIGNSRRNNTPQQTDSFEVIQNGLIIKTFITKFLMGPPPLHFDTAHILEKTYDPENRLIALKDSFTLKYTRELIYHDEPSYFVKYSYDKKGRVVYSWNSYNNENTFITYKQHNHIIRVYSERTKKLNKQFHISIKYRPDRIEETGDSEITLYKQDKKSHLYRKITTENNQENQIIHTEFIFIYRYNYNGDCQFSTSGYLVHP